MENKVYYKSNLGIFQQHSEHFDDCDADYISYPNFEKAVAEILKREKAIQAQAGVKPANADLAKIVEQVTTEYLLNAKNCEYINSFNFTDKLNFANLILQVARVEILKRLSD